MKISSGFWAGAAAALGLLLPTFSAAQEASFNRDYPTEARAEYVFGCMAANGQNQDTLRRCSCSIDEISRILTYDDYVAAETVLRMRIGGGEKASLFRGTPATMAILANLRRAQAEAEMMCF